MTKISWKNKIKNCLANSAITNVFLFSGCINSFMQQSSGTVLISKEILHVTYVMTYWAIKQITCVYSNSRNDVPRVAQRYGTIAAHTRRRASVLVVFVVFCVHMYSFAGLIRRTPPPTFSDTAITDRHSDTTNFQLRAHWVRISWSIGSEKCR